MSKTIIVQKPIRTVLEKQAIEKDLYWYDEKKKEMLTFKGGKLNFSYELDQSLDPPEMRSIPKVASVEVNVPTYKTDEKAVLRWFNQYLNYNNSGAELIATRAGEVEFEVPDEEVGDFLYDMGRHGLRGEI